MYISKFFALNYRSLRQVRVTLNKGKNVLVGKNNAGKSNIIRGIEILIGPRHPSYISFSTEDFFTEEIIDVETGNINTHVADEFYLEVELKDMNFDAKMFSDIKKRTQFYQLESINSLYYRDNDSGDIILNKGLFENLDDLESRSETVIPAGMTKKAVWLDRHEMLNALTQNKHIKIFFYRNRHDDEKSGLGLVYSDGMRWWLAPYLPKKFRQAIVTTTVISSVRSQKEDLRIVDYTWFGKLMKGLWDSNKQKKPDDDNLSYGELIQHLASQLRTLVDAAFASDTSTVQKLLEGAIAHKSVSFRMMNDVAEGLYKSIQIYINDGIDKPLSTKGTGIQSAIIIALFSLYCTRYHRLNSLLIAEEPELFLHPQARRVISAELDKFLTSCTDQNRQLIISTHSVEFLKNVDPSSIIRVSKDASGSYTRSTQLNNNVSQQISDELKRFIWNNNAEIFFADKVLLVEGGEIYLVPTLVDKILGENQVFDYLNISITRVNGKGSFPVYLQMLKCFDIASMILGDLDCFKDTVQSIVRTLDDQLLVDDISSILEAISTETDYAKIKERIKDIPNNIDAQQLKNVFNRFVNGEITQDDADLVAIVQYMSDRYQKQNIYSLIVEHVGHERFQEIQSKLRDRNIFIWSLGELESYYSEEAVKLKGSKDMRALHLSYVLKNPEIRLDQYFKNTEEIKELVLLVTGRVPA